MVTVMCSSSQYLSTVVWICPHFWHVMVHYQSHLCAMYGTAESSHSITYVHTRACAHTHTHTHASTTLIRYFLMMYLSLCVCVASIHGGGGGGGGEVECNATDGCVLSSVM